MNRRDCVRCGLAESAHVRSPWRQVACTEYLPCEPTAYLVAKSLMQARTTALFDWQWEALDDPGCGLFFNGTEVVQVVTDKDQWKNLPWGCTVYRGFGWQQREEFRELIVMGQFGRIKLV